ncbi:MAG: transposase [Anaerolinea sp.]|nr:transposase [Anaerolinea sp.]
MELYNPRKHHRRSTRLPGFDYSQPGYYFVTFCVHERECVLGQVVYDQVELSPYGEIIADVVAETNACFWNVTIDQSVIMPNHGHVIYVIHEWTAAMDSALNRERQSRDEASGASPDGPIRSLTRKPNLGQVVAIHKYESTKRINTLRNMAGVRFWQRGFYDHIVRNPRELDAIRQYILNNPLEWALDRDNPYNLIDSAGRRPPTGL